MTPAPIRISFSGTFFSDRAPVDDTTDSSSTCTRKKHNLSVDQLYNLVWTKIESFLNLPYITICTIHELACAQTNFKRPKFGHLYKGIFYFLLLVMVIRDSKHKNILLGNLKTVSVVQNIQFNNKLYLLMRIIHWAKTEQTK